MIIKSHIRGGYRAAAQYLKEHNKNEHIRLVKISDPDAANLDDAFHNMWAVANTTKAQKPLHHISINPFKDERLTDSQMLKIVERAEQKYGYKPNEHQRVIVEHILNGRQHFHVIWNRVNLNTGKAVWPGEHWKKSKQVCREMEKELALKRPTPKRLKRIFATIASSGRSSRYFGRYQTLNAVLYPNKNPGITSARPNTLTVNLSKSAANSAASNNKKQSLDKSGSAAPPQQISKPAPPPKSKSTSSPRPMRRWKVDYPTNIPDSEKLPFRRPEWDSAELLAWAWENGRVDILAQFGIYIEGPNPEG